MTGEASGWIGIAIAGLIAVGILLEGLTEVSFEWLERRMNRKQKIAATVALLVVGIDVATRGAVQIWGH
jgi:hypothetical protein